MLSCQIYSRSKRETKLPPRTFLSRNTHDNQNFRLRRNNSGKITVEEKYGGQTRTKTEYFMRCENITWWWHSNLQFRSNLHFSIPQSAMQSINVDEVSYKIANMTLWWNYDINQFMLYPFRVGMSGNQTHNCFRTGFKIVQGTSDWRRRGRDKSFYSFWTTSSLG